MPEDNIFEQAKNDTPPAASPVDQLVGEGKKYKSVEDLATAYLHADNHIREVTRDAGATREEMKAMREFIEAQFKERNAGERPPEGNNEPPARREEQERAPAPTPKTPTDEVDLKQRIKDALAERDEETKAARNARTTEDVMVAKFGSKELAAQAIKERAVELGVSPQWIADVAFRSPTAFYATMDISPEPPKSTSTPASTSDVNPRVLDKHNPGVKPGTKAYYDNIRKTNKGLYNTAAVQNALMKDALENPNFYK